MLQAFFLGGGVTCFAFETEVWSSSWICRRFQKTQERKVLLASSFCLWEAAGRQGSLGHCLLMGTVPFLSPSSAKNLTSPTEEKEPFLPAANRGSTDAFLGFGESPSCLPGSLWCRSHQGFAWRRGGGRPALFSGFSLGFLLLHSVALRLPWWAHTFPLAPSRDAPPLFSGEADTSLLKTLFSLSSQTPTVVHLPASPWDLD